jgi:hypothetical protein
MCVFWCMNKNYLTDILLGLQGFVQSACYTVHYKELIVRFVS